MDRDEVAHGILDVLVDASPEAHRRDERREVVVQQHEGGGFARDVRAAIAHRDPDVGRFERRGVVDAVARHHDDLAVRTQGLHQAQLLLGCRARVDRDAATALAQRLVFERGHLGAGQGAGRHVEACLAADRERCPGMVSGDHHDADARLNTLGERGKASPS